MQRGFSPLHLAAQNGDARIIRLLLERGASTETMSDTGFTALCMAARAGNERAVKVSGSVGWSVSAPASWMMLDEST